jgi:hypothetical protein
VHAALWIAAYVAVVLLWCAVLVLSRAPTLWRGSSLLFFNAPFIVASLAAMAVKRVGPTGALVVFDVVLIAAVVLLRDVWLLLHIDRERVGQILEDCFEKTRARYARADYGYVLTVAENQMRVMVGEPRSGAVRLRFTGNTQSKKAQLIRALVVKQFSGSFPALRLWA